MPSQPGKPQDHPLFRRFPPQGTRRTSVGELPTPYYVYDGHGLLIGGIARADAVRGLLRKQPLHPLLTSAGHALMAIWACDFSEASLGPHLELQFSFAVTRHPVPLVESGPLTLRKQIGMQRSTRLLCHGLWNSSETAVAYNRELLALPARLAAGLVKEAGTLSTLRFRDALSGAPLLDGHLHAPLRQPAREARALLWQFGPLRMLRMARRPWLRALMVNPAGELDSYPWDAPAYLAGDALVINFFDPSHDVLHVQAEPYNTLDFTPTFVEHIRGMKFVYLNPVRAEGDVS